ncbi:PNK3P-domain-containing protein [Piedraia hortae CBS 480.64]|uniref:PNK3P-domain-containing protein n=1 Tax=Piedraia hortae CBS 480.64 TaxID=1314780 RepID=A0A6A7C8N6_9PEZI|nr:PNK3P-domain-containing protein [Piedraia hortae CBS 480.64]
MSAPNLKRAAGNISPPPVKRRATTTSQAVANFFKPASQKEPSQVVFKILKDSLLIARFGDATTEKRPKPAKIAAFDLDSTLITSKSGRTFAKSAQDWQWWNSCIPQRLQKLHGEGYALVVMTNQAAIKFRSSKATPGEVKSLATFKEKVTAVLTTIKLPISLYAATQPDEHRKPRSGMWKQMCQDYGLYEPGAIDLANSIFVGDAAGRDADLNSGRKKDHSCADRQFAMNNGIAFHTPEEYFLGEPVHSFEIGFDPNNFLTTTNSKAPAQRNHDLELVLFCGSPGAGKSTYYWRQMQPLGYERANQDALKSRDRCMRAAEDFVRQGKSVVVDNTNADVETRRKWVEWARAQSVPVRLIHFTAPTRLCEHNDTVRALSGDLMNPEGRTMLPRVAFTSFTSRYREPRTDEGFDDIQRVDFEFEGTEEQKRLWTRFWIG